MKLLKFNLIFIPFLALSLGVVAYIARTVLLDDARQHVIQNARIIMETMLSSRTYTTKQIAPLLQQKNFKLQTAIQEFRKTIDQVPKTLDPNAAKDIRGNEKKGLYPRPAACARSSTTVPRVGERQARRTGSQQVSSAVGSCVRRDGNIRLSSRKVSGIFLQGSHA